MLYTLGDYQAEFARTKGARDKQTRKKRLIHGAIAIGSLGAATVLGAKVIKDYGAAKAARKAIEKSTSEISPKLTRDQMDDLVNSKLKGTVLAPVPKRLSTGANKGLTKQQRSELIKRRRGLMQGLLEKDSNSVLGKSSSLDVTRKPARGFSKITPKADRKYRATMAKQAGYRARRDYGSDYSSSAFLSDYQAEFARKRGARDRKKRRTKTLSAGQKVVIGVLGTATIAGLGATAGRKLKILYPKQTRELNKKLRSVIRQDRAKVKDFDSKENKSIFDYLVDKKVTQGANTKDAQISALGELSSWKKPGSTSDLRIKSYSSELKRRRRRDFKQQYRDLYVKKGELGSTLALGTGLATLGGYSVIKSNKKKK